MFTEKKKKYISHHTARDNIFVTRKILMFDFYFTMKIFSAVMFESVSNDHKNIFIKKNMHKNCLF